MILIRPSSGFVNISQENKYFWRNRLISYGNCFVVSVIQLPFIPFSVYYYIFPFPLFVFRVSLLLVTLLMPSCYAFLCYLYSCKFFLSFSYNAFVQGSKSKLQNKTLLGTMLNNRLSLFTRTHIHIIFIYVTMHLNAFHNLLLCCILVECNFIFFVGFENLNVQVENSISLLILKIL